MTALDVELIGLSGYAGAGKDDERGSDQDNRGDPAEQSNSDRQPSGVAAAEHVRPGRRAEREGSLEYDHRHEERGRDDCCETRHPRMKPTPRAISQIDHAM